MTKLRKSIVTLLLCLFAGVLSVGFLFMGKVNASAATENTLVKTEGAYARVDSHKGIRFTATISKATADGWASENGSENVTFGMLIMPKDYETKYSAPLSYDSVFGASAIYSTTKVEGKVQILDLQSSYNTVKYNNREGDSYVIKGTVANVLEKNLARGYVALAYAKVGSTVYTAPAISDERSVVDVCDTAYAGYLNGTEGWGEQTATVVEYLKSTITTALDNSYTALETAKNGGDEAAYDKALQSTTTLYGSLEEGTYNNLLAGKEERITNINSWADENYEEKKLNAIRYETTEATLALDTSNTGANIKETDAFSQQVKADVDHSGLTYDINSFYWIGTYGEMYAIKVEDNTAVASKGTNAATAEQQTVGDFTSIVRFDIQENSVSEAANAVEHRIFLPRIDYSKYASVSIQIYSNGCPWLSMDNVNKVDFCAGGNGSAVVTLTYAYDPVTQTLTGTATKDGTVLQTVTITDKDIINGNNANSYAVWSWAYRMLWVSEISTVTKTVVTEAGADIVLDTTNTGANIKETDAFAQQVKADVDHSGLTYDINSFFWIGTYGEMYAIKVEDNTAIASKGTNAATAEQQTVGDFTSIVRFDIQENSVSEAANAVEHRIFLPRINYSKYASVSIQIYSNGCPWLSMDNVNKVDFCAGGNGSAVVTLTYAYDPVTQILTGTATKDGTVLQTVTITDKDIINGNNANSYAVWSWIYRMLWVSKISTNNFAVDPNANLQDYLDLPELGGTETEPDTKPTVEALADQKVVAANGNYVIDLSAVAADITSVKLDDIDCFDYLSGKTLTLPAAEIAEGSYAVSIKAKGLTSYTLNLTLLNQKEGVTYINKTNAATLADFIALLNATPNGEFVLTEDLDFGGEISGAVVKAFTGTFDGAGHTISNFEIKYGQNAAANNYISVLIENNSGTIKNLGVDYTLGTANSSNVGLIERNDGTVENLFVTVSFKAYQWTTGAIAAINGGTGTVKNCITVLNTTLTDQAAKNRLGSIVGVDYNAKILNCYSVVNGIHTLETPYVETWDNGTYTDNKNYADMAALTAEHATLPATDGWSNHWTVANGTVTFGPASLEKETVDLGEETLVLNDGNYTVDLSAISEDILTLTVNGELATSKLSGKTLTYAQADWADGFTYTIKATTATKVYALKVIASEMIALTQENAGTAADLKAMLSATPNGKFKLAEDLDLGGGTLVGAIDFAGTLDGNGYVIKNFNLNYSGGSDNGYNSYIFNSNSGTIKDIGFVYSMTALNNNKGAIILTNTGTVENVYVDCTLACSITSELYQVGALTHTNNGTIKNVVVRLDVNDGITVAAGKDSAKTVGVITSYNSGVGVIENSYAIDPDGLGYAMFPWATQTNVNVVTDASEITALPESEGWNTKLWKAENGTVVFNGYYLGKASVRLDDQNLSAETDKTYHVSLNGVTGNVDKATWNGADVTEYVNGGVLALPVNVVTQSASDVEITCGEVVYKFGVNCEDIIDTLLIKHDYVSYTNVEAYGNSEAETMFMRALNDFVALYKEITGIDLTVKTSYTGQEGWGYVDGSGNSSYSDNTLVLGVHMAKTAGPAAGVAIYDETGLTTDTGYKVVKYKNSTFLYGKSEFGTANGLYALLKQQYGLEFFSDTVYTYDTKTAEGAGLKLGAIAEEPFNPSVDYNWAIDGDMYTYDENGEKGINYKALLRLGFVNSWRFTDNGYHNCTNLLDGQNVASDWILDLTSDVDQSFSNLNWKATSTNGDGKTLAQVIANVMAGKINGANTQTKLFFLGVPDHVPENQSKYGTSDQYLAFVNSVAAELEGLITREDKIELVMMAYAGTVTAPTGSTKFYNGTKVDVKVMYAPIRMLQNYDADDDAYTNPDGKTVKDFMDNYATWKALGDEGDVYVWNYSANFDNFFLPTDTIAHMQSQYQAFVGEGITHMMNQGAQSSPVQTNFAALKTYLKGQLAKDVNADVDTLIRGFCNAYYGVAGQAMYDLLKLEETHLNGIQAIMAEEDIWFNGDKFSEMTDISAYYNLMETKGGSLFASGSARPEMLRNVYWKNSSGNNVFVDWYAKITEALAQDGLTAEQIERIQVEAIAMRYMSLKVHGAAVVGGDTMQKVEDDAISYGITMYSEGEKIENLA